MQIIHLEAEIEPAILVSPRRHLVGWINIAYATDDFADAHEWLSLKSEPIPVEVTRRSGGVLPFDNRQAQAPSDAGVAHASGGTVVEPEVRLRKAACDWKIYTKRRPKYSG